MINILRHESNAISAYKLICSLAKIYRIFNIHHNSTYQLFFHILLG